MLTGFEEMKLSNIKQTPNINLSNMEEMKLSNSFIETVTEKQGEMKECEEQIKELIKQKEKIV